MHPKEGSDGHRTASEQRSHFVLWSATILFMVFVGYVVMVGADYILARRLSAAQEKLVSEPAAIELRRQHEEDEPQREAARKRGYQGLIFPDVVERYTQLRRLADQLKIAPLAPHPNSRLYYCNEGYGLITYESDRFGFRNPNRNWDQSVTYVLIGDSFTQGACVPDETTITGILGKSSTVLNLGVSGDNPIHYAATARQFIPLIKPAFAVMVFYANDNDAGDRDSLYYRYFLESKSVNYFKDVGSGVPVLADGIKKFYADSAPLVREMTGENGAGDVNGSFFQRGNVFGRAARYLSLPTLRATFGSSMIPEASELPFSSRLAIETLVAVCKSSECQPIVIYIPNSEFWRPDPRSNHYATLLAEYSKKLDVSFFDNTPSIRAMGETAYAIKGAHLSPQGYATVAKNLLELSSNHGRR